MDLEYKENNLLPRDENDDYDETATINQLYPQYTLGGLYPVPDVKPQDFLDNRNIHIHKYLGSGVYNLPEQRHEGDMLKHEYLHIILQIIGCVPSDYSNAIEPLFSSLELENLVNGDGYKKYCKNVYIMLSKEGLLNEVLKRPNKYRYMHEYILLNHKSQDTNNFNLINYRELNARLNYMISCLAFDESTHKSVSNIFESISKEFCISSKDSKLFFSEKFDVKKYGKAEGLDVYQLFKDIYMFIHSSKNPEIQQSLRNIQMYSIRNCYSVYGYSNQTIVNYFGLNSEEVNDIVEGLPKVFQTESFIQT